MRLQKAHIRRYRALADVTLELRPINVFFGQNAAGKSSFLDAIWFVRDCAIRGVEEATGDRDHGIGLLWDEEEQVSSFSIELETENARYKTSFGLAAGRVDPHAGELLVSKQSGQTLIDRSPGQTKTTFYHQEFGQNIDVDLREPSKLALTRYLDLEKETAPEALEADHLLRFVHLHDSRSLDFYGLRRRGSESSYQTKLWDRATNLWSVLRNLHDRRSLDDRFSTIVDHMRRAFPKFKDLLLEQTGTAVVIGQFVEEGRRQPIQASGVSDGFLQLLILLTALFSEGRDRPSLIMLDEPETSLHPHAIAVLAQAIEEAAENWQKQVMLATHSPVLMSQFAPENVVMVEPGERGQAIFRRVSEIGEIQDLLDEYALGSLYMAEAVAAQDSGDEIR
jgi:predicted ATPase